MVSFSCENCGDVLTKKKLDPHRNQCRGASYTCIDCMVHFHGTEYRSHTSCISEAQKYQGNLYKEKKGKGNAQTTPNGKIGANKQNGKSDKKEDEENEQPHDNSQSLVPRAAYVEEHISTSVAIVDAPPEAPEPPPNVNVFDFLVSNGGDEEWESERDDDDMHPEPSSRYIAQDAYDENGYYPADAPVPIGFEQFQTFAAPDIDDSEFVTPAQRKTHNRDISMDSTGAKKSGKRKRGQPEGLDLKNGSDIVMTDVPPAIHSGLTGGLSRLMSGRNAFPPSPDLSADAASPHSPMKRSKHTKEENGKKAKRKSDASDKDEKKKDRKNEKAVAKRDRNGNLLYMERRRSTRKRSASPSRDSNPSPNGRDRKKQQLKAIEYHPLPKKEDMSQALVKIEHANPTSKHVDTFLTCLVKGSETDEGVSLWKALKRWKKEGGGKGDSEKELWKGLKVRANEAGELVICV